MSTKAKQEKLASVLRAWQKIETQSVAQTAKIIDRTRNPAIRLVMEIIQRDSAMHHRIQQFIIDSLEENAVSLTVDELEHVWTSIEAHIEVEKKTTELVDQAQEALRGTKNVLQQFFLRYLATDERKHDLLLEDLELIKRGMFKSA